MRRGWAAGAARITWTGLLLLVAATPLVVSTRTDDGFRLPKLLFFQCGTLTVAAFFAIAVAWDEETRQRLMRQRFVLMISAAAILWTAVATLASRNPIVSHDAPFTLFCYALFFVMVSATAREPAWMPLAALSIPVVVTSLYAAGQFFDRPTPFVTYEQIQTSARVIGLLGNPNYLATFLLLPTIAVIASSLAWPRFAPALLMVAAIGTATILASQTMTALLALAGGMVPLFFTARSWRRRLVLGGAVSVVIVGIALSPSTRVRLASMKANIRSGEYYRFSSQRLPAFAAAGMMFRERPVTGAGPGVFAAEYLTRRLQVDELHPEWFDPINENFGEVHNDHLQVLAETGVPAYAILLALIGRIGWMSFRPRPEDDSRTRFVRILALPSSVAFALLALAQFPMQLAASATVTLFLAGLCFAWERTT